MKNLFADPVVRLAGRAVVAGLLAGAASYQHFGGSTVAWHAVAAAAVMAFLEVFTPLNALVGVAKSALAEPPAPPPAAPARKPRRRK